MKTLLHIDSSLNPEGASRRMTARYAAIWQQRNPDGRLIRRDLTARPLPHYDATTMSAFFSSEVAAGSPEAEKLALSDRLIEELQAADEILIGVPMYNFTLPSQLKAWFDHIARAGVTFRYGENGPEGLLQGKRVTLITASGGRYLGPAAAADHLHGYLHTFLGFVGLDLIDEIRADGLATAESEQRLDAAIQQLDRHIERAA